MLLLLLLCFIAVTVIVDLVGFLEPALLRVLRNVLDGRAVLVVVAVVPDELLCAADLSGGQSVVEENDFLLQSLRECLKCLLVLTFFIVIGIFATVKSPASTCTVT